MPVNTSVITPTPVSPFARNENPMKANITTKTMKHPRDTGIVAMGRCK